MAKMFQIKRVNGISDDAVKEKTGRKWGEWFKLLDKLGARMMDHRDIAAHLRETGLSTWWIQTVSAGYEQDRGLRIKHQRGIRYAVDVSKTVGAPLDAIWNAWQDPAVLERWLPGAPFEFGKITPNRILHLKWHDGSRVTVTITGRAGKSRVLVSHGKLPEKAQIASVQAYWSEALERLKAMLQS